jgi:hypothetical protein
MYNLFYEVQKTAVRVLILQVKLFPPLYDLEPTLIKLIEVKRQNMCKKSDFFFTSFALFFLNKYLEIL